MLWLLLAVSAKGIVISKIISNVRNMFYEVLIYVAIFVCYQVVRQTSNTT